MRKFNLNKLNERIEFGSIKSVENPISGTSVAEYSADFSLWCGIVNQSLSEQYDLLGRNVTGLITVAIRHDDRVADETLAKFKGVVYDVVNVDSERGVNTFDTVSLKKSSKVS